MRYFISEKFLKEEGIVSDNVDVKRYAPLIQTAARAFLRPMIGSYFFDDLLLKYNNQTLSPDEIKVVDIMKYSILWRATAEAGVSVSYQLTNKGYQTQSGDFSTSPENSVVWKMYDHYIQKCITFDKDLGDWLLGNKNLYPNFTSKLNNDSTILNSCNGGGDYMEGVGILVI